MEHQKVSCTKVLMEDLYCICGAWIYCPDMNGKTKDINGNEVLTIGEGCLHVDENGEYLSCPDCKCKYYLF